MTNIDKTMNINDEEVITQETDTETTDNQEEATEEVVASEEVTEEESVEDLKKKLATAEAQKEHWREKAKGKAPEANAQGSLSSADLLAVMNAKVHEDDLDEVVEYARFKGISVKEALKSDVVKSTLAVNEEKRTTATATNVSNVRRGSVKVTDETLIANASSGKLPESDAEIARLMEAKFNAQKG